MWPTTPDIPLHHQWWTENAQSEMPIPTRRSYKTPQQTAQDGAGQCNDLAAARMHSMIESGIPAEHLRLAHVAAGHLSHMVLLYQPDNAPDPLVLDNMRPEILPMSLRPDLKIFYKMDNTGRLYSPENKPLDFINPYYKGMLSL